MARWPENVDDQVMQSFNGSRATGDPRLAAKQRSALIRAFTAILMMLTGGSVAAVGVAVALGHWAWGLAVIGVLLFVIGMKVGDNS